MSSDTSSEGMPRDDSVIERRLATILCADVAGYSQLMGANEERTVRVFRGHREVFESLVRQYRGRIFNTAGDALLVEFASAVEAVRCATDIQAALRSRNERLAPEERMQFRMGINLGDVIVQGGDLLGDGVNVAARIQTATEPGGICISGTVHDQIQNKLSLSFKALGEQKYKNIANPVRTFTLHEGGVPVTRSARSRNPMIAAAVALGVALAGGAGYWNYRQAEAARDEQARVAAQLTAQLAAQTQATRQAQRAAEDAKREAQHQAQKQAADEAMRRAQDERARVEQDRKALENEKKALTEAAKKQVAPSAAAAAPLPAPARPAANRFDGVYAGRLCNQFANRAPNCWPVELTVRDGAVEGSWPSRAGPTSTARGRLDAAGAVALNLQGWSRKDQSMHGTLTGRVADGAMTVSGQWGDRATIDGTFKQASTAVATPQDAKSGAGRHDGDYIGQMCHPWIKPAQCWAVPLRVRNGAVEGSWVSENAQKAATVRGTLAPDGALRVTASSWTKNGTPTDAHLVGALRDGTLAGTGRWDGGAEVTGRWKRP
ncbi:hypothetical protein FN976_01075 [Caenimonas sedimenti]|uniref:Guanylate cyclase domain-containing protein n=1 Tax=Caenimonas sedimenti TaxID=2596921 RepID=A0A562ZWX5_9BURK|nr:adenylate/guanylate cyclase domain-containing protein [Caenimonas sedimenti]TWO72867.1 hypothetical protein FN976_01075 [Caenimonas sedimenti]